MVGYSMINRFRYMEHNWRRSNIHVPSSRLNGPYISNSGVRSRICEKSYIKFRVQIKNIRKNVSKQKQDENITAYQLKLDFRPAFQRQYYNILLVIMIFFQLCLKPSLGPKFDMMQSCSALGRNGVEIGAKFSFQQVSVKLFLKF